MKEPKLRLGIGEEHLDKQLTDLEYSFDPAKVEHFEKDIQAVMRLVVRKIILIDHGQVLVQTVYNHILKHITEHQKALPNGKEEKDINNN